MPEGLWGDVRTHFLIWLFITFPIGVAVYLGLVGAEHGIRYFTEARERQLEMATMAEQLASARLGALQAKVNPHCLFNTLNTITVLVRDGERDAASRILEPAPCAGAGLIRSIVQQRAANWINTCTREWIGRFR